MNASTLTRKEALTVLAALDYTGPTSYPMPKLRSIVAACEAEVDSKRALIEQPMRSILKQHCQACGSTHYEDISNSDGYTACCNERVVGGYGPCDPNECYHN